MKQNDSEINLKHKTEAIILWKQVQIMSSKLLAILIFFHLMFYLKKI